MSAPELVPGYIVAGKYAVQTLLFHGGSAATYHAITAPSREVALKIYDPALKSFPQVLEGLARYQAIGAGLPGSLVSPIVDSGSDEGTGAPYTVTDFDPAPSLAQLVELCPVSVSEMAVVLRNLARAVDVLHTNEITHLSLHPRNVFVGPGPNYEVRVGDFGTSLVRGVLPAPEKSGRWLPWLAPEQMNDPAAADRAADIFSMALVAFFAATGRSYWRSCQSNAPKADAWEHEISGPRAPISERGKELSAALPPELDAVFARALAARPGERFKAARELSAAVDAALAGPKAASVPRAGSAPRRSLRTARSTMMGIGADPIAEALAAKNSPPTPAATTASVPVPATRVEPSPAAFEATQPERTKSARADTPNLVAVKPISVSETSSRADDGKEDVASAAESTLAEFPSDQARRRARVRSIAGAGGAVILMAGAALALANGKGLLRQRASTPRPIPALTAAPSSEPAPAKSPAALEPQSVAIPDTPKIAVPDPPKLAVPETQEIAVPEAPSAAAPQREEVPPPDTAPAASASSRAHSARAPAPRAVPVRAPPPRPAAKSPPCGRFLKRCK